MLKQDLRIIYKKKRACLREEDVKDKSLVISKLFKESFLSADFPNIHIFLPIENKVEINTWIIINDILFANTKNKIIISKSNIENCELSHFLYEKDTVLKKNIWGIPEPEMGIPIATENIHQVLIPLLCFDKYGNRVGYGKGFYDKFLAQCNPDVQKIGLSFFDPVDIIEDTNDTDIKMNYCITPDNIYSFNKSNLL
jgi:5-formyltetrahydrofolate cyclo-ligase